MSKNLPLDLCRDVMVTEAIKAGMDYIFFLDSDTHPLDRDMILKLVAMDVDIASGLYFAKKEGPKYPAAWQKIGEGRWSPIKADNKGIVSVDAVGMGCCLIKIEVFKKLAPPWYYWTHSRINPKTGVFFEEKEAMSEDFHFCNKARAAGYEIFVNMDLKCKHEGSFYVDCEGKLELVEV